MVVCVGMEFVFRSQHANVHIDRAWAEIYNEKMK